MEEITRDMLPEAHGRLAEVIGVEATVRLCKAYGGTPLYIPKLDALIAARRARMIRSEFDGANTAMLARRYGVSMRTVQTIVSNAPARRAGGRG
jgi:Mor family transcriptional regulator